ncbi:hypothetical protein [Actinoplanes sp. NPDC051494]|uniref:hypothetical protein n=1 Tax=Actinoplanes sp. NPDC051494 TaxID=3363907 RepID=UPI003788A492
MSAYPLDRPSGDPRFTMGLLFNVIAVLTGAGYPPITSGPDLVRLQEALFGFLYTTPATVLNDHPGWCRRQGCDALGHMSEPVHAGHVDEPVGVDVALVQLDLPTGTTVTLLELGVTGPDPGDRHSRLISLDQGDELAVALRMLQRRAAG